MSRRKIIIGLVVLLAAGGFAAKTFALPKHVVHEKINGTIYILPKAFTVNLADNRYGTLTVALVLAPGQSTGSTSAAAQEPDGFGTLPEEAAIRDLITNIVTDQSPNALITASGRAQLKQQILSAIRTQTDVKVTAVLFTDVAVQ